MDAMRPKAAALAAELVEAHIGPGPIDFVNEIAAQVPARIIADILGIPRGDLPVFMQWIADTAEALGFINLDRRDEIEKSLVAFNDYVAALLADRRASPREDFLSQYVEATVQDGELSKDEIRTQIVGLILAGSDTTRGSLCMTLAHLLQHVDQWRAFCADPDGLKRAAVDEGLRFDPVIMGIPRIVVRDFDLDGYRIPAGTLLTISVPSALRDPSVYTDPDHFDIFRKDHPRWHPISGRVRIAASVRHSPASRWRKSSRQLHGWRRARGWLVPFRDLRLDPYARLTGWRSNFWADSNVCCGVQTAKPRCERSDPTATETTRAEANADTC
jgi:cytochrome P450